MNTVFVKGPKEGLIGLGRQAFGQVILSVQQKILRQLPLFFRALDLGGPNQSLEATHDQIKYPAAEGREARSSKKGRMHALRPSGCRALLLAGQRKASMIMAVVRTEFSRKKPCNSANMVLLRLA